MKKKIIFSSHFYFRLDNNVQPPDLHEETKVESAQEDPSADETNSNLLDDNISLEYDDSNNETIEIIDDAEKIQKLLNDHQKKQELMEKSRHEEFIRPLESDAAISVVVVDPDERYLLSCLPVLKRVSHQKNALLKMKIQQLLYEVEFEMNDDEPMAQRKRCY
jgi:translation initiation factor IF-2